MNEPTSNPAVVHIEWKPSPWVLMVYPPSTRLPLTCWQQIVEYLKVLYR